VLLSRIPQLNSVTPRMVGASLRNGGIADEFKEEWEIKFEKEWAKKRADLDAELLQDAKDYYMRTVKELANELRVLEANVNKIKLEYEALAQKATPAELAEANAEANAYMVDVIKDAIKDIKEKESKFKFDTGIPEGTSAYYRELASLACHTKYIIHTKILENKSYYSSLRSHLKICIKYRRIKEAIPAPEKYFKNTSNPHYFERRVPTQTLEALKKKFKTFAVAVLIAIGLGGGIMWFLTQNRSETPQAKPVSNRKRKALMLDEKG
jgi:hypothetical protein